MKKSQKYMKSKPIIWGHLKNSWINMNINKTQQNLFQL